MLLTLLLRVCHVVEWGVHTFGGQNGGGVFCLSGKSLWLAGDSDDAWASTSKVSPMSIGVKCKPCANRMKSGMRLTLRPWRVSDHTPHRTDTRCPPSALPQGERAWSPTLLVEGP